MRVGWCTFRDMHNRTQIGSTRIRADWVIKYWEGAELYRPGRQYDIEIYQKSYWTEHMKRSPALKILDVCDPDWTDPDSKINEALELVDAITVPTERFKQHFYKITDLPVKVIPDRLDMEEFDKLDKKQHEGEATEAVWFGYSHNMQALQQAVPTLRQKNIRLNVISDDQRIFLGKLDDRNLYNFIKYDEQEANRLIRDNGDFALLPYPPVDETGKLPYDHQFKSNNKTITAWALGLPVATNAEQMEHFIDEENRKKESEDRLQEVRDKYDSRQSVVEYLELIRELL